MAVFCGSISLFSHRFLGVIHETTTVQVGLLLSQSLGPSLFTTFLGVVL